jgi:hypothetical protein
VASALSAKIMDVLIADVVTIFIAVKILRPICSTSLDNLSLIL